MAPKKMQKIEVDVTCRSEEHAMRVAEKHRQIKGVIDVSIVGTIVKVICEVVADQALVVFGKLKDVAFGCEATCRPLST